MKLAPSFIRRVFASSKLAPTSPMWCPTPAAQQFGRKMPRPFTMCGSIKITGPPGFFAIARHSSGRFANISAHDHETSEVWLIDLASPDARPTLVAPREAGVQYEVEHHPAFRGGPALIIRTDADGAEDFKISWAPLATPRRACWRDLVAHWPGVYVLSFMLLMDWLIRLEREDGLPRIVGRHLTSEKGQLISFCEKAYS